MKAHVDAVLALLDPKPITVYEAKVPEDPALPYAVVFPDLGSPTSGRVTYRTDRVTSDVWVNFVGTNMASVLIVGAHVQSALRDVTPTVPGRVCWPIREQATAPIRPDQDIQPPVLVGSVMFRLSSTPAPA